MSMSITDAEPRTAATTPVNVPPVANVANAADAADATVARESKGPAHTYALRPRRGRSASTSTFRNDANAATSRPPGNRKRVREPRDRVRRYSADRRGKRKTTSGEEKGYAGDDQTSYEDIDIDRDGDEEGVLCVLPHALVRSLVGGDEPPEELFDDGYGAPPRASDHTAVALEHVVANLPASSAEKVRAFQRDFVASACTNAKKGEWLQCVARLPVTSFSRGVRAQSAEDARACLERIRAIMDGVATGLSGAKNAVLETAGKLLVNPGAGVRPLLLEGQPGSGKTTFAVHAIGAALNRPTRVINLGGAKDASSLTGACYTYEGARPGRVYEEYVASGVCDPVIVFDELDKVSDTNAGYEIMHVLTCVTDPLQRHAFADTYLSGVPLDLSRAFIVFTCNDVSRVNPILLDRLRVVNTPDMDDAAKADVVRTHVAPRVAREYGFPHVRISEHTVKRAVADADRLRQETCDVARRRVEAAARACSDVAADGRRESGAPNTGMRGVEQYVERMGMIANLRCLRERGEKYWTDEVFELTDADADATTGTMRAEIREVEAAAEKSAALCGAARDSFSHRMMYV